VRTLLLVPLLLLLATSASAGEWRPTPPEPWESATVACALLVETEERRPERLADWIERAVGTTRTQLKGARALLVARDWSVPTDGPGFVDYLPIAMSEADYERAEALAAAAEGAPVPATAAEWLDDVAAARLRVVSLSLVQPDDPPRRGPFAPRRRAPPLQVVDWRGEPLTDAEAAARLGERPPDDATRLRRLVYDHNEAQRARIGAPKPDDKMRKGANPDPTPGVPVDYDAVFESEDE